MQRPRARTRGLYDGCMVDPDFMRLMKLGAIELELQTLEAGGVPSRRSAPADMPVRELCRLAAFLAYVGKRLLKTASTSVGD